MLDVVGVVPALLLLYVACRCFGRIIGIATKHVAVGVLARVAVGLTPFARRDNLVTYFVVTCDRLTRFLFERQWK